jgi:hypothetical protein
MCAAGAESAEREACDAGKVALAADDNGTVEENWRRCACWLGEVAIEGGAFAATRDVNGLQRVTTTALFDGEVSKLRRVLGLREAWHVTYSGSGAGSHVEHMNLPVCAVPLGRR